MSVLAGGTVLGVWQGEFAGAFLYGLGVFCLDLCFTFLRSRLAKVLPPVSFAWFVPISFLGRVLLYLAAMALAVRIFNRTGLFVVGLAAVCSAPLGILAASRLARSGEG